VSVLRVRAAASNNKGETMKIDRSQFLWLVMSMSLGHGSGCAGRRPAPATSSAVDPTVAVSPEPSAGGVRTPDVGVLPNVGFAPVDECVEWDPSGECVGWAELSGPADECVEWDPSGECVRWGELSGPADECVEWDPSGECVGWGELAAPSDECVEWDPSGECVGWEPPPFKA